MRGFQELTETDVSRLDIGMQVFIKLTGKGWSEDDKEEEGLYHVGADRKLWSEDGSSFFFIYEMNQRSYEYKVYIPDIRYKLNSIANDIKTLMRVYHISINDVCEKIKEKCNG